MRTIVSVPKAGFTMPYAAPEVLEVLFGIRQANKLDVKADVYAWGRLMWEVMRGKCPGMGYLEPPAGAPANAVRLYERCVREKPKGRPTSAELVTLLELEGDGSARSEAAVLRAWRAECPELEL